MENNLLVEKLEKFSANLLVGFDPLLQLKKITNHYKDPFDRLLISSVRENLSIVSEDQHFKSYPVNVT